MQLKFGDIPKEQLADVLRQFYGSVLSKNGKEHSHSGLINLQSGLNYHLHSPPHQKCYNLMEDKLFT